MFVLLDSIARRLVRKGLRRGLLEGNFLWLGIGVGVALLRMLFREQAPRVEREDLALGESITVRHVPPPGRRSRTRADVETL